MSEEKICGRINELASQDMPGLEGITKKVIFGPENFWPDYVMRLFSIEPGGEVPLHSHDWPHYIVSLQGQALLGVEDKQYNLEPMCWAYVPGGKNHSFQPRGKETFVFICIVPREGDTPPGK